MLSTFPYTTLFRSEAAIQRATHLRRNTQGAPLALGNEHGLYDTAAGYPDQKLAGAVGRVQLLNHLWRTDFRALAQLDAQIFADIGHIIKGFRAQLMDPFEHLSGAEALFPDAGEVLHQLGLGQPQ